MIENIFYIGLIYFFLILALCIFVPFCNNITDDGIYYGIKETFAMFKDKDFYLIVIIPVFINFGIIFIFCNLIIFVISLVIDKINL